MPRVAALLLAALVLAGCGGVRPAEPGDSTALRSFGDAGLPGRETFTYCAPGGDPLTLDFYRPQRGGGHPLAVFFHGGGFEKGASGFEPGGLPAMIARGLYDKGFAIASVNYRLAPEFRWPAMIVDAKCAVRYLRAHARGLGIDPRRVAAFGSSAGALLANLLGTTGDDRSTGWDQGRYRGKSSAVEAVADLWGPTDIATLPSSDEEEIAAILGSQPPTEASPVNHVSGNDPPFFIVQGVDDTTVPPSQASELRDALVSAGVPVVLRLVQNAGHGLDPTGGEPQPSLPQLSAAAVRFLVARLR